VAFAGKLEVAGADGAYLFEEFYNFFAFHSMRCRRQTIRASMAVVAHSLKARAKSVNANVDRRTFGAPQASGIRASEGNR
jgi:hypothetical protein